MKQTCLFAEMVWINEELVTKLELTKEDAKAIMKGRKKEKFADMDHLRKTFPDLADIFNKHKERILF